MDKTSITKRISPEPEVVTAELIPKTDQQLTQEEKEVRKLRNRLYHVCHDAMSYLHSVAKGEEKGNRTRMRACESFVRFLPTLDHQAGTQPLHLHLNVPRPNKREGTSEP